MKYFIMFLSLTLLGTPAPVRAQYTPGATLAADLSGLTVTLVDTYATQRPRVLFYGNEKDALIAKKNVAGLHWTFLFMGANGLGSVPSSSDIEAGTNYYRAPRMLAGAVSWYLTDNTTHRDNALAWMLAHCNVATWGTGWNENVDITAAYYTYYISLAYDVMYDQISSADSATIITSLISHAGALYGHVQDMGAADVRYDQNHTYMPVVALLAAGLALADIAPDADDWIELAYAVMRRCRYVLGDDGFYYEGTGYWTYAMHWHLRAADMLTRATGEDWHDLGIFKQNYLMGLHTLFPGGNGSFDIGDGNHSGNGTYLNGLARAFQDPDMQAASDLQGIDYDFDTYFHTAGFMWYDPDLTATSLDNIDPYHHFTDHDIVFWRSGWDADATAMVFKCGPSEGHQAAVKLSQLTDWYMNDGHTHPDIASFWMYAKGKYLARDTGYLYNKRTVDHNGILVDDFGMANDGSYWVYRGEDYGTLNEAVIEQAHMEASHAYARGDFSTVYTGLPGTLGMKRHVLMTAEYLVVLDDLEGNADHTYSWLLHTANTVTQSGDVYTTVDGAVKLEVNSILPAAKTSSVAVHSLTRGSPPNTPTAEDDGYLLRIENTADVASTEFLHVLAALDTGETGPTVDTWSATSSQVCIKITGSDYTDYFMAALGDSGTKSVANPADAEESFGWTGGYGYVRVRDGVITASGSLGGYKANKLKLSGISELTVNGDGMGFEANGDYIEFPTVSGVDDGYVPDATTAGLITVTPNPFVSDTRIRIDGAAGAVRVSVHDGEGNMVRELDGGREASWDGRNADGTMMPSGTYFLKAETVAGAVYGKLFLMR